MAAFAPIPSASERMAIAETNGVLTIVRSASFAFSICFSDRRTARTNGLRPRGVTEILSMEREPARLAHHIKRTVTGPMWHGSALAEVLEGVTPEQATTRPIPGAHTIWELVAHVTAWAEIARARVHGERLGD